MNPSDVAQAAAVVQAAQVVQAAAAMHNNNSLEVAGEKTTVASIRMGSPPKFRNFVRKYVSL